MLDDQTATAVARIENLFTISEIEVPWLANGVHYTVRCARAITGHYTVVCACGWSTHTGTSASAAHALMRAHVKGHDDRVVDDVR